MARKRFAIELGYAADLHGEDMTKAAVRAVRDAVSRICLCGIVEICGRDKFQGVYVHADIAVPFPDEVDQEAVLASIPIGETSLNMTEGGLSVPGIEVPCFAPGVSNIVVACAALTISIEMELSDAGI
ncbi:Lin0512 family protein [Maridesulfovibrio zosterae]|uniref:Lin0512 family protein n=1 Tax=Maridesulfovibrio zosterae TaxID=82171 RepID=UPI0004260B54|nr:Lin0512 family protein [Maridesulfovibrio zosterae]